MSVLRHRPLGERIPDLPHAVSCSLPTLDDVIGYEERRPAVIDRMSSGYPRFVKHPFLRQVAVHVRRQLGVEDHFWPCASPAAAEALLAWMPPYPARIATHGGVTGVFVPNEDTAFRHAKTFLQHAGLFLSSREAEDYLVREGVLPRTDRETLVASAAGESVRNVVARLSGAASPDEVLLANCGMNAVYSAFKAVDALQRSQGRTVWIQLGWLYLDTIAILQKFCGTPSRDYVMHGNVFDLDGLRALFSAHAGRIAGVITEIPTNPLIQTCNLPAVAELCRREGAALIADPTINCVANLQVLPHCDVLVTSLTKYFAAEGDVIAGALVVNPDSPFAPRLRDELKRRVEPLYPRDLARLAAQAPQVEEVVRTINASTPAIVETLSTHPAVDEVFWAHHPSSRSNYVALSRSEQAVGSMVTFTLRTDLARVYDRLKIAKGPSFGMHTSLACPFMYLAHYDLVTTNDGRSQLESFGLNPELIRLSVGTEPTSELCEALREALG
ncbi:MAG: PLP-dependent transferase [Opitutaceae bacterium]|nr:PLP-dependent transferase [Opitutaceae bacterium]